MNHLYFYKATHSSSVRTFKFFANKSLMARASHTIFSAVRQFWWVENPSKKYYRVFGISTGAVGLFKIHVVTHCHFCVMTYN